MGGHCCFSGCLPCESCGHCINDSIGHTMVHSNMIMAKREISEEASRK